MPKCPCASCLSEQVHIRGGLIKENIGMFCLAKMGMEMKITVKHFKDTHVKEALDLFVQLQKAGLESLDDNHRKIDLDLVNINNFN